MQLRKFATLSCQLKMCHTDILPARIDYQINYAIKTGPTVMYLCNLLCICLDPCLKFIDGLLLCADCRLHASGGESHTLIAFSFADTIKVYTPLLPSIGTDRINTESYVAIRATIDNLHILVFQ